MLPVCPTCRADGALPIARRKRRNGDAIHRSGRCAHLIPDEVGEVKVDRGASGVVALHGVVSPTRPRVARRERRRR